MLDSNRISWQLASAGSTTGHCFAKNQIRCLERQIKIAEEKHLPIIIFERRAEIDIIKIFEAHQELANRTIIKGFTGDTSTLRKYLRLGFHISISGAICDDAKYKELRRAVEVLPLDTIGKPAPIGVCQ